MAKKYKIVVPKPASCNEYGTEVKLYKADEIVESEGAWKPKEQEMKMEH